MKEFDCKEYQFLFDAVEKDELVKKVLSGKERTDTVNAKRQKDVIILQLLKQIFFTNIKLYFVFLALSWIRGTI